MSVADMGDFESFIAADQSRTEPFFEFLKRFFHETIEWKDLFFVIRLSFFGHNNDEIGAGFLGFQAKFVEEFGCHSIPKLPIILGEIWALR